MGRVVYDDIAKAVYLLREIQHLADVDEVIQILDPVIGWAYNAYEIREEDWSHAKTIRQAMKRMQQIKLPNLEFLCSEHPYARVDVKIRVRAVGDPDEAGTVFDRDTDHVFVYGVCSVCCREVIHETRTSRMIREHVQRVLAEAYAALSSAACTIEEAVKRIRAAALAARDAQLVREALIRLGLNPEGGEEALLAWATAPERHDMLQWALDPIDGCFGNIRNLRRAAARVAEHILSLPSEESGP
jgi:hypothetical protein